MGTPKYVQIAEVLQRRIAHGDYLSGALPGAPKLMQEFGISYMTTRQAMQKLIDDGTVIRAANGRLEVPGAPGESPKLRVAYLHHSAISLADKWRNAISGAARKYGCWGAIPLSWRKTPEGYHWNGYSSGMDNTPRGRDDWNGLLWFDAVAQQGLAARSIAELAAIIGNESLRGRFQEEYRRKTDLLQHYWDPETGAFQDRRDGAFCRVLTPAIFWPMAAKMAPPEQAKQLAAHLENPEELGGSCPCPTVSRNDPAFTPEGAYWRGSVWVPLAYVTSVALRNYGFDDAARRLTGKLLTHMDATWRNYTPHSIWECYKPDRPEPALNSKGRICRADFCGWSALGPISMLIENLIGISEVSAQENRIRWTSTSPRRHGIRNLRFGGNTVSLLCDAGEVSVTATRPFTLEFNGVRYACPAGKTRLAPAEPAPI